MSKLMQVRVRFPLLEAEFDLPAEPIEAADQIAREWRGRQIGTEPRHRRLAAWQHHHAEADHARTDVEVRVEIQGLTGVPGEEPREADSRRHGLRCPSTQAVRIHGS
jgi:hypothetical protein